MTTIRTRIAVAACLVGVACWLSAFFGAPVQIAAYGVLAAGLLGWAASER